MPNRNENTSRCIRHALEKITPTSEAKGRMYAEIMRQASLREQPKKRPWYLRRQASVGICTAALVCVATVTGVLYARMPQDGKNQLEIVSPTVTTAAADMPTETEMTAASAQTTAASETVAQTKTAAATETAAEETAVSAVLASAAADSAETESRTESVGNAAPAAKSESPSASAGTTEAQSQTPQPTVTTAAQSQQNAASAAVTTEAAAVWDTPAAVTTAAETIPIRRNIYLYYLLRRGDILYSTTYQDVPANALSHYIGYGVTRGDRVTDTHTVIMYAIVGVSEEKQIAVQYAGEENYYLFTAQ